jgi:hypothetical protein
MTVSIWGPGFLLRPLRFTRSSITDGEFMNLARYFNTTEAIEKLLDEYKSDGAIPERIERVRKSKPNVGVYTSEDPSLLTASRLAVQHIITKHNLKTSANELFKTKQELPEEGVGDTLEDDDRAGGSSVNAGVRGGDEVSGDVDTGGELDKVGDDGAAGAPNDMHAAA